MNHGRARLASGVSSWKKPMSGSQSSESVRRCAFGSRSRDPSLRLGAPGAMCSTSRRPREGVAGVSLRFSISSRSSKHRLAAPVGLIPLSTCRDSAWGSGHAPLLTPACCICLVSVDGVFTFGEPLFVGVNSDRLPRSAGHAFDAFGGSSGVAYGGSPRTSVSAIRLMAGGARLMTSAPMSSQLRALPAACPQNY